jgi:hypothetical protein
VDEEERPAVSIIGSFDPSVEDYPSGSVTGSLNLVPNSSAELSNPGTAVGDFDIEWSTDFAFSGERSIKVTVDTSNSGTSAWVRVPAPDSPSGHRYRAMVYIPEGSPLIGETLQIGRGTGTSSPDAFTTYDALEAGWQATVTIAGAGFDYLFVGINDSSTLPNGAIFYIDDWSANTISAWEPADGEPFFTAGQQWVCTADGTFQGLACTTNDILTCVSSWWLTADDASWELTPVMSTVAEALTVKPIGSHGVPIGLGDWRFAVEMLLPEDGSAAWGVGTWGESTWSNIIQWKDLTPWVRGLSWSRGSSSFAGRPEVGVLDFTLENLERQFSPWNGVSAWNNATNIDGDGTVAPGYFAPGSMIRVVAFSPSEDANPLSGAPTASLWGEAQWGTGIWSGISDSFWVPQFTGVVESWQDATDGAGAESFVNVTVIETLSTLVDVEGLAVTPVGADEIPALRLARLLDDADWRFGDVDDSAWMPTLDLEEYALQATTLEGPRISEMYLVADSTGTVIRSGKDGRAVIYNIPELGGLGTGIRRGPDKDAFACLSWQYDDSDGYCVPTVVDSPQVANDDEVIVNEVTLGYVGGSENVSSAPLSIDRYGRRSLLRTDLICQSEDLIDELQAAILDARANLPIRLVSVQLHSDHEAALIPLIGLDVHSQIDVELPPLPTHWVNVTGAYVDSMTHYVTPLNSSELIWTCDLTFGIQQGIRNIERT